MYNPSFANLFTRKDNQKGMQEFLLSQKRIEYQIHNNNEKTKYEYELYK